MARRPTKKTAAAGPKGYIEIWDISLQTDVLINEDHIIAVESRRDPNRGIEIHMLNQRVYHVDDIDLQQFITMLST